MDEKNHDNHDDGPGFTKRQVDEILALGNRFVSAYVQSLDQSRQIRDLTAQLKAHSDALNKTPKS